MYNPSQYSELLFYSVGDLILHSLVQKYAQNSVDAKYKHLVQKFLEKYVSNLGIFISAYKPCNLNYKSNIPPK